MPKKLKRKLLNWLIKELDLEKTARLANNTAHQSNQNLKAISLLGGIIDVDVAIDHHLRTNTVVVVASRHGVHGEYVKIMDLDFKNFHELRHFIEMVEGSFGAKTPIYFDGDPHFVRGLRKGRGR